MTCPKISIAVNVYKDAKGIKLNDVNKERNVDALYGEIFALATEWQHFLK